MVVRRLVLVLAVLMFCRLGLGDEPVRLDAAAGAYSRRRPRVVLVDTRL